MLYLQEYNVKQLGTEKLHQSLHFDAVQAQ